MECRCFFVGAKAGAFICAKKGATAFLITPSPLDARELSHWLRGEGAATPVLSFGQSMLSLPLATKIVSGTTSIQSWNGARPPDRTVHAQSTTMPLLQDNRATAMPNGQRAGSAPRFTRRFLAPMLLVRPLPSSVCLLDNSCDHGVRKSANLQSERHRICAICKLDFGGQSATRKLGRRGPIRNS